MVIWYRSGTGRGASGGAGQRGEDGKAQMDSPVQNTAVPIVHRCLDPSAGPEYGFCRSDSHRPGVLPGRRHPVGLRHANHVSLRAGQLSAGPRDVCHGIFLGRSGRSAHGCGGNPVDGVGHLGLAMAGKPPGKHEGAGARLYRRHQHHGVRRMRHSRQSRHTWRCASQPS